MNRQDAKNAKNKLVGAIPHWSPHPIFILAFWRSICGCGGASPAATEPTCPVGDVTVQTDEEAAALAPCTAITGSLTIGPSMALTSVAGLAHIARTGGALEIRGNVALAGAYLPALREVGGDLAIEENTSLENASLQGVVRAGGAVRVRRNRVLERLDLGALTGGTVLLEGNPRLEMIDLGRARERSPQGEARPNFRSVTPANGLR